MLGNYEELLQMYEERGMVGFVAEDRDPPDPSYPFITV